MWGIIPAAGSGTRIQPLAFSKELLPVGSRFDGAAERPRAVSEYLVERLLRGGARKLCFVIAPGKSDILEYFGGRIGAAVRPEEAAGNGAADVAADIAADIAYVVQPEPAGLCDAIFRALPLIHPAEEVAVGLPDTVWFPEDGLCALPSGVLSFLLFPVERPEFFDAVVTDPDGRVREIQVKRPDAGSSWIWGAFRMPGRVLHALHALWCRRGRSDAFIGTLVNAWIAEGGEARGVPAGRAYVDVGTLNGYREAIRLLGARNQETPAAAAVAPPSVPVRLRRRG